MSGVKPLKVLDHEFIMEPVAWGFVLVILAGVMAPVGACVCCFMQRQQHAWLAASISLAAGVMVFVSLTEGDRGVHTKPRQPADDLAASSTCEIAAIHVHVQQNNWIVPPFSSQC